MKKSAGSFEPAAFLCLPEYGHLQKTFIFLLQGQIMGSAHHYSQNSFLPVAWLRTLRNSIMEV